MVEQKWGCDPVGLTLQVRTCERQILHRFPDAESGHFGLSAWIRQQALLCFGGLVLFVRFIVFERHVLQMREKKVFHPLIQFPNDRLASVEVFTVGQLQELLGLQVLLQKACRGIDLKNRQSGGLD